MSIFGVCGFFGHSGVPLLRPRRHMCSFVGKWSSNVCFEGRFSWLVLLHRDSSQAKHNTGKPKQDVLFKKLDF